MIQPERDFSATYLTDIGKLPLLSHEEEIALARRIESSLKDYRSAVFSTAYVLEAAVDLLADVRSGATPPHFAIERLPPAVAKAQRLHHLLARRLPRVEDLLRQNRQQFAADP